MTAMPLALLIALPVAPDEEPGPVSAERIAADVATLAGFGTRHTLSEEIEEAADWLAGQFREAGCDEVAFHEFPIGGKTRRNVVATITGSAEPDTFVLVIAHYDSRNERISDFRGPSPGAVDNASGTAALLAIARALAGEDLGRSVRLVAFSGEEQGLIGSRAYANMVEDQGMTIPLLVNLDMIGHPMDPGGRAVVVDRDQGLRSDANDAASARWAERLSRHAEAAGLAPEYGPMYGSDYIPFEAAGVVCVGLFDGADKAPFYHDAADTPDKVDAAYCASVTAAALAVVREAAGPGA